MLSLSYNEHTARGLIIELYVKILKVALTNTGARLFN